MELRIFGISFFDSLFSPHLPALPYGREQAGMIFPFRDNSHIQPLCALRAS